MKVTLTATSFFSGTFGDDETPFASLYGETATGAKVKAMFWGNKAAAVAREIDNLVPEGVELRDVKLPIEVFGREKTGKPNPKKPGSQPQPYIDVDRFNILTGPAMELHRSRAEALVVLRAAEALSNEHNYDEAYSKLREFIVKMTGVDATEEFDLDEVEVPVEDTPAEGPAADAEEAAPEVDAEAAPVEKVAEGVSEDAVEETAEAAPYKEAPEEVAEEASVEAAPAAEDAPDAENAPEEPVAEEAAEVSEEPQPEEAPAPVSAKPFAAGARKPGGFGGGKPAAVPAAAKKSTSQARSVNGGTATKTLPVETPEAAAARDVGVDISAPKPSFGRRRSKRDDPLDAGPSGQEAPKEVPAAEEPKAAPKAAAPAAPRPAVTRPAAAAPRVGAFGRRPGMKPATGGGMTP